jgi:signal transduction histidine kinase
MTTKASKPNIFLYHPNFINLFTKNKYANKTFMSISNLDPLYIINLNNISDEKNIENILDFKKNKIGFSFLSNLQNIKDLEKCIKQCDSKAGMFFYSDPKDVNILKTDIEQIETHLKAVNDISLLSSNFYNSVLNCINYGISIINKDNQILYTNQTRRNYHGKNIIGKCCYSVFPYDSNNRTKPCPHCPIIEKILTTPSKKHYRCEVHKLSSLEHNNEVYFATEAASLIKIDSKNDQKLELGLNVVKDNTSRILFQEFSKLIQPAKSYSTIIEILKFALLGGLKSDFQKELKEEFSDQKGVFRQVMDKLTYVDNNGTKKILNFKIGRFRFYRIHNDTFKSVGQDGDTLQLFKSYEIDKKFNPIKSKLIGNTINYNINCECDNELSFDPSGKIKVNFEERIKNIFLKNKENLLKVLKDIDLIENGDTKIDINKHVWYDIKLKFDNKLFGYISFDWKGRENEIKNKNITDEHLSYLKMLIDFSAQAIQKTISYKISSTVSDLNKIIGQNYGDEYDMLYNFARKICLEIKALRFEVFLKEKGNVNRKFVYYFNLEPEINKAILNSLEHINVYDIKKGLIGASIEKIEDYWLKTGDWLPINIFSYNLYDKYFKKQPQNKIRKKFLSEEKKHLPNSYKFRKVTIKNCLIAPLVLRDKLFGVIKLSNNLFKGNMYFPLDNKTILHEAAKQLAIRMEIFRGIEKEKRIDDVFNKMSDLFIHIEKSYTSDASISNKKLEVLAEEIIRHISKTLVNITKADCLVFYSIKKDHNKDTYSIEEIYNNKIRNYEFSDKDIFKTEFNNKLLTIHFKNSADKKWEEKSYDLSRLSQNDDISYSLLDEKIKFNLNNINNDYFSFLVLLNSEGFETDLFNTINSINKQLCSLLKLHVWIRRTDEVIYNVGHQVISPLTGLSKYCDNLLNSELPETDPDYFGGYKEKPEKKTYALNLIRSQTALVRSIAERSRVIEDYDLGKPLICEPPKFSYNFKSYLIKIASIYQPYAKEQQIRSIKVRNTSEYGDERLNVLHDKTVLLHIFSSLIDNAIKYSDKNIKDNDIIISINYDLNTYNVTIRNLSKIAIPYGASERIFNRLVRLPEAKKIDPHGSGIGLYLSKKICLEIGGDCTLLISNKKEGTIFNVKLPNTFKRKE